MWHSFLFQLHQVEVSLWEKQGELVECMMQTQRVKEELAELRQQRDEILRARGVDPAPPAPPVAAQGAPAPAVQAPAHYAGPPYPKLDIWYGIPQLCIPCRIVDGKRTYRCTGCGKSMKTLEGGIGHYRRRHASRIPCRWPGCSYRMSTVKSLMTHEQTDHTRPPLRPCKETSSEAED